MSSTKLRTATTYSLPIAVPLICLLLGILDRSLSAHKLNDDGADFSLLLPYIGLILGLVSVFFGAILGLLTAYIFRNHKDKNKNYSLYAFMLLPSLAILYMVYGAIWYMHH